MSGVHVKATNLRTVHYDPEKKMLEVEFHSGGSCQFYGVPESVYQELLAAESREHYFDRYIRLKYSHRHFLKI